MNEEETKPAEPGEEEAIPAPEGEEAAAGTDPSEAAEGEKKDPLTAANEEAAKWKDLALRSQAELENFRKRMAREKTDAIRFANSGLLTELLPLIDNFEMGLGAARAEGEESVITKGMEMVHRQIEEFLASNGAKEIAADSGQFDPLVHEAVKHEHHPEIEEGEIIRPLRKGYRLHDRLLRAPNVVVSKGPKPEGEESEKDASSNSEEAQV